MEVAEVLKWPHFSLWWGVTYANTWIILNHTLACLVAMTPGNHFTYAPDTISSLFTHAPLPLRSQPATYMYVGSLTTCIDLYHSTRNMRGTNPVVAGPASTSGVWRYIILMEYSLCDTYLLPQEHFSWLYLCLASLPYLNTSQKVLSCDFQWFFLIDFEDMCNNVSRHVGDIHWNEQSVHQGSNSSMRNYLILQMTMAFIRYRSTSL